MRTFDTVRVERSDPLAIDTALPLQCDCHPAGFLLRIATNSRHVLDAAREAWSHYPRQLYPCAAIEFRVVVKPEGPLSREPSHRAHGHLYTALADADNLACCDLEALRASIFVSERTAADHNRLRWCFVESLAYMLLAQRYVVPVHAACVARENAGVLLCGPAGAGKSTLAYACARAGWRYLADDAVFLLPDDERRIAIGQRRQFRLRPDAPRLFPELAVLVPRVRANGRVGIEAPLDSSTRIKAAGSARIMNVIVLDRRGTGKADLQPIPAEEVTARLLRDMPSYGAEVNAMHERCVRRLEGVPSFRLRYSGLADAVECLDRVAAGVVHEVAV